MKKLFALIIILALVYGVYSVYESKQKQNDLLKKEVAALQQQNELLTERVRTNSPETQTGEQRVTNDDRQKRLDLLRQQLDAETKRLIDFQKRRESLVATMNDPGSAGSIDEVAAEIKEKNETIQALQFQLTNHQDEEQNVDHAGEQAKQDQNVNKAATLSDLNVRIRAQQQLIRNTQAAIQSNRIAATADSTAEADRLVPILAQQKIDLETMRRNRDQVNLTVAVNTSRIHQQMGYAKNSIRANEQGIRAQINELKNEIKALQSQNNGAKKSVTQVKQQINYVDQQISTEKNAIDRIQNLMKAEQ